MMGIITLTTDFGLKDGNVGVMKGVILGIAPQVQIVDLSHNIHPQDILEAGLILRRSAPYFPSGTIHIVVVDPGVGTHRRPLAAWISKQFYVGPDNGTITELVTYGRERHWEVGFIHLDQPHAWLEPVSHVFHGRDIFAPVAAHLANGVPLFQLGTEISDPVLLNLPQPVPTTTGWVGEVIHIDHFGNISTNIECQHISSRDVRVRIGGVYLDGLVNTFGDGKPGDLVALFGSTGNLIVSEVNGNAAARLQIRIGAAVTVEKLAH
jgi:S-adenosylmethionine hydrolase